MKLAWTIQMVARELRSARKSVLLFSLSVVLGVAALVATEGLTSQIRSAVQDQSKSLLGADLVLQSRRPFGDQARVLATSIAGERALIVGFANMIRFPGHDGTRLARIRAVEGNYPFYGTLETQPPLTTHDIQDAANALVDASLMAQFGAQVGDDVVIGDQTFKIAGSLLKVPGEAALASSMGPRIFVGWKQLDGRDLLTKGSRVTYSWAYRTEPGFEPDAWVETAQEDLRVLKLKSDTVHERQRAVGTALENLFTTLNLIGLAALIIGGIGVSSSMHLFARRKIKSIAVLQCLGASPGETVSVYTALCMVIAIIGSLSGSLLGLVVQWFLPGLIQEILPVQLSQSLDGTAVARAFGVSVLLAFCFALLPFASVWGSSPLVLLRSGFGTEGGSAKPRRWILATTIIMLLVAAFTQANNPRIALAFIAALFAALFVIWLGSRATLRLAGIVRHRVDSYVVRQGIANLSRPHNQTLTIMVTVGLVAFAMLTHQFVHGSLMHQLQFASEPDRPNLVLFDIQDHQLDAINALADEFQLETQPAIPMVTMRLSSVNGTPVHQLVTEDDTGIPEWAAFWEYRSTYRAEQNDTETLTAGQWVSRFEGGIEGLVPISIESTIAETLHVQMGDDLTFEVLGVRIQTRIASIREVQWQSMKPNFYVVFPTGVLEDAPKFFVQTAKSASEQRSAAFQSELVNRLPNVSVIDLRMLMQTVDDVIAKATFAIRFMAGFFLIAAIVVMVTALYNTRFERIEESAILRAIGAERSTITAIFVTEYAALGLLSTGVGALMGWLTGWAVVNFALEIEAHPPLVAMATIGAALIALTVAAGALTTTGQWTRPVMTVLKAEQDA